MGCAGLVLGCAAASDRGVPTLPTERTSVEAGYIELEARTYSYAASDSPEQSADYRASPARLFHVFVAAEQDGPDTPLFVFCNGGPGSATTGNLLAFGTGPSTLLDGDASHEPAPNPFAWTKLGHLLYIDARQSGFSYSTLADPESVAARREESSIRNLNAYVDAADFLSALLTFLAAHPDLRGRRIVFVAESYGGMRTALVFNYLFDSARLTERGAWYYTDPSLVRQIHEHLRAVFPLEDAASLSASQIATQFGHQILIQPLVVPNYQFRYSGICDPEYGLGVRAQELELPCPAENGKNDPHHLAKPPGWMAGLATQARQALSTDEGFRRLIGVEPTAISGLARAERRGAFRGADLTEVEADLSNLERSLGALPDYDHYFLSQAAYADPLRDTDYGGQDTPSIKFGRFFLRNLVHVKTFVTRALLDSVINADRLPAALAEFASEDDAPISGVALDVEPRDGYARPGWITITYTGRQFDVEPNAVRVIRFPTYADAGHAVSACDPEGLFLDVRDFVHDTAAPEFVESP